MGDRHLYDASRGPARMSAFACLSWLGSLLGALSRRRTGGRRSAASRQNRDAFVHRDAERRKRVVVKVKLTRKGRTLLRKKKRLKAVMTLTVRDAANNTATQKKTFRIRR